MHLLPRQADPAGQRLVIREQIEDGLVGGGDILRVAGQGGPAERALALAEQRPDVGGHEAGEFEGPAVAGQLGLAADRVAVVEDLGARVHEADHGFDLGGHRLAGSYGEPLRVLGAQRGHVLEGDAARQVGERVVGRGLVGDDVDGGAAGQEAREDVGGVAEQADGQGLALVAGFCGASERVVYVARLLVQVAELDPPADAGLVALDADDHAAIHRHGQRLGTAHASQPRGQGDRALERSAESFGRYRGEGLVGALQDALGADVDPRARGHLAVHGQAERLQAAELLPGGPLRDEVGVGDEDPRCPLVGSQDTHGLAGLDQEGLVVLELFERPHDGGVGVPAAGGAAGATVDDELLGVFGNLGVEVVHQHAHRGFLRPSLAGYVRASGCADRFAVDHVPIMAGVKFR